MKEGRGAAAPQPAIPFAISKNSKNEKMVARPQRRGRPPRSAPQSRWDLFFPESAPATAARRGRMPLPIQADLADIEAICGYLLIKPAGASLAELVAEKAIDRRKLSALKFWGLIEDAGTGLR